MSDKYIIELLKRDLREAVSLMREHAAKVGPQHSWWEFIADYEGHLETIAMMKR